MLFSKSVFESVFEKTVIRGYNDEGVEEPLKITFVYKTGIHSNLNGKDFKPKRKNAAAVHNDAELCSYTSDETEKLCLHSSSDTCRVRSLDVKSTEVNTEKGLKTRCFRELGVRFSSTLTAIRCTETCGFLC